MAQDLASEFVADLYRRERKGIARSVARIAGESHAEDLVHDAFVAYLVKSPWATKPAAWVQTVARNRALNELRRPKQVPLTGFESGGGDAPAPEAEREAIRTVVASALGALPERSLVALRMKFFEGADYPQIAGALGVRIPQAHVIVHRALRRLGRELVGRMADAHGASGCAPALLRMAGLGGGDDAHGAAPCPVCRPAWDEIVALKIGGWMPAPLLLLKDKIRSAIDAVAGRLTVRGPLVAEPVSRAATAFVALGVAASTMAPSAASLPSAAQRPAAQVARPAAGTTVQAPVVTDAGSPSKTTVGSRKQWTPPRDGRTTTVAGNRVTPPKQPGDSGQVKNDTAGGAVVCTNIGQPCSPPDPDDDGS